MADTGRPLLLDFGAARRVIGDMTQALTAILKPGYAPVEQYADMPGLKQGPWTDVYALAAVVHWMIMRKTPPPSVGRLFDDPYVPLAQSAAGRYSDAFLRAIDHALAVMPEKRTASIEAMRVELFGGALPAGAPIAAPPAAGTATQEVPRSQPHPRRPDRDAAPRADPAGLVPATEQRMRTEAVPAAPAPASSQQDAARGRRHRPDRGGGIGGVRALAEGDASRNDDDGDTDGRPTGRHRRARGVGRCAKRAGADTGRGDATRGHSGGRCAGGVGDARRRQRRQRPRCPRVTRRRRPKSPIRPPRPTRGRPPPAGRRRRASRRLPPRPRPVRSSRRRPTTAPNAPASSS